MLARIAPRGMDFSACDAATICAGSLAAGRIHDQRDGFLREIVQQIRLSLGDLVDARDRYAAGFQEVGGATSCEE